MKLKQMAIGFAAGNEKVLTAVFILGWVGLVGIGLGEFTFGLEPTSGSDAFPGP